MAHSFGTAARFLVEINEQAVHCETHLGRSIAADLSAGEPPRPRKFQLDEAAAKGYEVEHRREEDDATNRRIAIDLQHDTLAVVEQLRLTTPPDLVKDVLVNGVSIYAWFEELDGPKPEG